MRSRQGRREVGAAAPNGRRDALARRADESAHDRHATAGKQRLRMCLQLVVDLFHLRNRAPMLAIGDDDLPGIQ